MSTVLKYCFLCVVFCAFGIAANAQDGYTGKIGTKYDQAKNETSIELAYVPVSLDKGNMALLNVSASFPGTKMKEKPDDVIFVVSVVNAKGHKYEDINRVAVTSGGGDIGQIMLLNLDQRAFSESEILETLGTRMPLGIFRKLAAAKQSVSFKIAETTFTIQPDYILKLAEFDKAINP